MATFPVRPVVVPHTSTVDQGTQPVIVHRSSGSAVGVASTHGGVMFQVLSGSASSSNPDRRDTDVVRIIKPMIKLSAVSFFK